MKKSRVILTAILAASLCLSACGNTGDKESKEVKLNPSDPVMITVWNYYTGQQQEAFNKLVDEFNQTEGKEQGIIVKATSQGSVTDLENEVIAAINKDVGADKVPNIFAAYSGTAYQIDQMDMLADIGTYMTDDEISEYLDSYIEEGKFSGDGSIKIFPTAKAIEVFMLNKTDWDKFAAATGADIRNLNTMEGVTETAKKYYEWTDSLTPEQGDGKAFFGRDAVGNYMIIGSMQLGKEMFTVDDSGKMEIDFDKGVVRKLWDNYYVPYVNGYFAADGRFRSDDIKTGSIVAFVGSSSGATFFPDQVILNDEESYQIETEVLQAPQFEGSEGYAVQQGAGMAVTKSDDTKVKASVEFLKWFTDEEQNLQFAIDSGYLPVKKEANDKEAVRDIIGGNDIVKGVMEASIDTINDNTLYTTPAQGGISSVRKILDYSMSDLAAKDRETAETKIRSGMPREEAVKEFISDGHFEEWYVSVKQELENAIQ